MIDNTIWSQSFDFTTSSYGFATYFIPIYGQHGQWIPNVGWQTVVTGGGDTRPLISIKRIFANGTLTSIDLKYSTSASANGGSRALGITGVQEWFLNSGIGNFTDKFSINISNATELYIKLDTNTNATGPNTILALTLRGIGVNPFLNDDCVACAVNYIGIDIEEAF